MTVFALKPLKVIIKESSDPIELFLSSDNRNEFVREVCFCRLTGINCSDTEYVNIIENIDKLLQKEKPDIPYIRLNQLKTFSATDDLGKYADIYDGWHLIKNEDFKMQLDYSLTFTFQNATLELTLKKTFRKIIDVYESETQHVTATMVKNFGIKLLYWIDLYFPLIFIEKAQKIDIFPKILYVGDVKKAESLFLYFLSLMGCDLLYMNPAMDLPDFYKEITQVSKLHNCGPLRKLTIPVPEFNLHKIIPTDKQISTPPQEDTNSKVNITPQAELAVHDEFYLQESNEKELSYEELAALSPAIVMIKVYDDQNNVFKTGSGVVINKKGLILTNCHVINGGMRFAVQFENDSEIYFTDYIIKSNYNYDLAVINSNKPCNPITVSKSPNLRRGQKVVAIGSPLGLFNTVSDGIISGFRDIGDLSMIQFTAPTSRGSSGGALLDMKGRLIGIITGGYDDGQNLNLAVDCNTIVKFIRNFI